MKKLLKSKSFWGYFIPALLLILFILFLYYRGSGTKLSSHESSYKSVGYFVGGNPSSDLDIRRVRWHKHVGFERVVFDCYRYDGVLGRKTYVLSSDTGEYEIGKEKKNALEIDGEIKGYRSFSAILPSFDKSKLIRSIELLNEDNGAYLFTIHLKKSTPYKVFTLSNPARIVIDLKD